jgi:glycosyltransferase involved in cell wall biosynthesis
MSKTDPLVSVLMPAFNSEQYIAEAIESVLAQTYPYWELLLCDDGSTDGTKDIMASFTDDRIRYLGETNRLGVFGARNFMFKSARGKYITYLDADDFLDRRRIELQVSALEQDSEAGMVGCQVGFVDPHGKLLRTSGKPTTYEGVLATIYSENVMGGAFVMFRRNALVSVGGGYRTAYFGRSSYQDYDLALLLAERMPCYNLPEVLYYYRQHASSSSKQVSVDRLIVRELVLCLAKQRQQSVVDWLMEGKTHLADAYLDGRRQSYSNDPGLVYRHYAANFMYNKMYRKAISTAMAAVKAKPMHFENWRTLQYCVRKALLGI